MTTRPTIYAIIPLIEKILPHVHALYEDSGSSGRIDLDNLGQIVNATKKIHLTRIDDPAMPVLKKDTQGRETTLMMWGHPDNWQDPDYIVAFVCKKTRDTAGTEMFTPELVIRGSKANVLIVGGMSCCGTSVQTHWTQVFANGQRPIDAARVPLSGIPHPEHVNWLKGKIFLADTINKPEAKAVIQHMLMDVFAAREPGGRFAHACASVPDYVQYADKARAHTLG